jgi:hypothetical protein
MKWFNFNLLAGPNFKLRARELFYFMRTSDAVYFLMFSVLVGSGGGFGAVFFRWLILQFKNLFFTKVQDLL